MIAQANKPITDMHSPGAIRAALRVMAPGSLPGKQIRHFSPLSMEHVKKSYFP